MLKKIFVFVIVIAVFAGCTKDDICPEGSATTPRMVVSFMDISDPTQVKEVSNLRVTLIENEEIEIISKVTDTIYYIPLNPSVTTVAYSFTKDADADPEDENSEENSDEISFTYGIGEDVYMNRACGFKTTYTDLEGTIESGTTENPNWMLNLELTNDTVENEDITHITIFH